MSRENEPGLPKHEFDKAVRDTVTNRLDALFVFAETLAAHEPTHHQHLHFVTREPRFTTAVDVIEFKIPKDSPLHTSTDRVKALRPVVDPGLLGHDKSVEYWLEFHGPHRIEGPEQVGMYLEIGPDHDRFVWAPPENGADVLEFPDEVGLTTGGFLVTAQSLIEMHGDSISPRFGHIPPNGTEEAVPAI